MTDTPQQDNQTPGVFQNFLAQGIVGVRVFFGRLRAQDFALSIGVFFILAVMLVPIPTWALDIFLALSLCVSFIILVSVLMVDSPLKMTAFPTVLLLAAMIRLALNIASTRLILTNGQDGPDAAGEIIQAFGLLMAGGNYIIGIVVFGILVIINFIVITKGAGRIAEVSARFTLDAMPGKQMAIDADLAAQMITEDEARTRRKEIESEASFFGSMDGASKFVRGDAIAGLLITFINIIGGIIIGVVQQGLELGEAGQIYTLLTIGDGLVSQIPALIVSTAAGMLTTKVGGSKDKPDQVVFAQLGQNPNSLGLTALLMLILAVIPGLPALPFVLFAFLTGAAAYFRYRTLVREENAPQDDADGMQSAQQSEEPGQETIAQTLGIDKLRLEMGYSLLSLINEGDFQLTDQIRALRRQIASEHGFVMPAIRIQDNLDLSSNEYRIVVKEIEAGKGILRPAMYLAMGTKAALDAVPGENTSEPTYGLPAKWISETSREDAIFAGLTVVDCATVISTHLTELIKEHMAELLSYAETKKLLQELPEDYDAMVKALLPDRDSTALVQRVMQNLLSEHVSIRDVPTIVEAISEAVGYVKNVQLLTEHVRSRLARQITEHCSDSDGILRLISVSGEWERSFVDSLAGEGEDQYLAMAPSTMQDFLNQVRTVTGNLSEENSNAVILCGGAVRSYVRTVLQRFMPHLAVLSEAEIYAKAKIRTVASI